MERLASLITIALLVAACTNPPDEATMPYPASNLNSDDYSPGPDWTLVWSDEFDGDTLDPANWNRQVVEAGRFNDEWQRYTDSEENSYLDSGCLVIKAIHVGDSHGMNQYTSARLNTAGKQAWTFGKIAARIQLPYGQGMWPAFWTLGANINENGGDTPWPQTGEIDILELYGYRDNGAVEANIHYADSTGAHAQMGPEKFELEEGRFADAFHVFEIEWNENEIIWSVDGQRYASTPITSDERTEFHHDHFVLLNVATGSTWAERPDETTVFPQYMYVDWVRVYQEGT